MASRAAFLAVANAMYAHFFGLLTRVGSPGKKSKTEAMYYPARVSAYDDGDTSDMVLDCGGTVSSTQSFDYLGSLLHCGLSDHHDVDARIKKAAQAFGALRNRVFSSREFPSGLRGRCTQGASSRCCYAVARHGVPHGRGHHAPE